VVDGQGFSVDIDALYAYAGAGAGLASEVTEVRTALDGAGALPGGVFGEVGESSGFVAAVADTTTVLGSTLDGLGRGIDGLGTAVRGYVDTVVRQEDDTVSDLRRAEEPV
jgi:hypothetical protein